MATFTKKMFDQAVEIIYQTEYVDSSPIWESWNLRGFRVSWSDSFEGLCYSLNHPSKNGQYKFVRLDRNEFIPLERLPEYENTF